jgi:hypothetical protein
LIASIVAIAVAMSVIACGSNGSSDVGFPDPDDPVIDGLTGVVYVPPAVLPENNPAMSWWPVELGLVSTAYANLFNEVPVGVREAHVSLVGISEVDTIDGMIDMPDPIVQSVPTDADGRYQIIHNFVETFDVCESINEERFVGRLMVSVSIDRQGPRRSFVSSRVTDIDASTEAVVRLVLRRIREDQPPVQLCDFSVEGLRNLTRFARNAAFTAEGDTINEINADAFRLASENCKVRQAIDDATGVPVVPPRPCLRG